MNQKHFLNVKRILEERKQNKTEVAKLLFPDVRFPRRAFSRILTGEAELSASQVSLLAEFLQVDVTELYQPDRWLWKDTADGKLIFVYGINFRVEINLDTWEYAIHYKDEIIDRGTTDGFAPVGDVLKEMRTKIQDWIDLA